MFTYCSPPMITHFSVLQIYAIGLIMNKSRLDGPLLAQKLHTIATTTDFAHLKAYGNPLRRSQAMLLLTIYCLHMPSHENIISISSMTIRFCIMNQFHLVETEPQLITKEDFVEIQLRRRVFWIAYAIDRAVCATFDFPLSIPDEHITAPVSSILTSLRTIMTGLVICQFRRRSTSDILGISPIVARARKA